MVRTLGKTLLLLLILFILGNLIAGAISVRGTINNTEANLRRSMPPIVGIGYDYQAFDDSVDWSTVDWSDPSTMLVFEDLTIEHVQKIGELSYVEFYTAFMPEFLYSFDLKRYFADLEGIIPPEPGMPQSFDLRGNLQAEPLQFSLGFIDLIAGRTFNDDEFIIDNERSVAIISEGFAQVNNFSLGSTFDLYYIVTFPSEDGHIFWDANHFRDENIYARVGLTFEVIGIFTIPEETTHIDINSRLFESNVIYVPSWACEEIRKKATKAEISVWDAVDFDHPWGEEFLETEGRNEWIGNIIFVLKDPLYISEFRTAAEQFLPEFYLFEDLSNQFNDIAMSMVTLQNIADWILIASIGASLMILSLVITLFLRDRRHEIGIYLSLGETKTKIVSQFLLEIIIISFIGITLAVFSGHFISSSISQEMVRTQLIMQAEQRESNSFWEDATMLDHNGIPTGAFHPDEMMEAFDVSLSASTIGLFYVVGLGTVILSTVIPVWYVVKLNPKEVLL